MPFGCIVDDFLAGVSAIWQPLCVDPQRFVGDAHEHVIGAPGPSAVDAFAPQHGEFARCVFAESLLQITGKRVGIERAKEGGELIVVERGERAVSGGLREPVHLLIDGLPADACGVAFLSMGVQADDEQRERKQATKRAGKGARARWRHGTSLIAAAGRASRGRWDEAGCHR